VLRSFLCPLSLASDPEQQQPMGDGWEGWPFGRNLYVAEIASMIQRVPGVKHVLDVELSTRPVVPSEERSPAEENSVPEEVLQPVEQKVVKIAPDTLLCSLQHEVVLVALDEDEGQDA
ncbi:MAG: hypothetical protein GX601_03310, partial [Anaerolineales bacterium]|nr:hypothetical protein [Anaerolineales bacterium]